MPTPSIALVGDYNPDVTAHRAIPLAIELASRESEPPGVTWLSTEALVSTPTMRSSQEFRVTNSSVVRLQISYNARAEMQNARNRTAQKPLECNSPRGRQDNSNLA
jgi:hypothetical protein